MSGVVPRYATSLEYCDGVQNLPGRIRAEFDAAAAQFDAAGSQPLKGLRIGVPSEFVDEALAPDVADAVRAALQTFESLGAKRVDISLRSEEHTSELQSLMRNSYAVFCLKKTNK